VTRVLAICLQSKLCPTSWPQAGIGFEASEFESRSGDEVARQPAKRKHRADISGTISSVIALTFYQMAF